MTVSVTYASVVYNSILHRQTLDYLVNLPDLGGKGSLGETVICGSVQVVHMYS